MQEPIDAVNQQTQADDDGEVQNGPPNAPGAGLAQLFQRELEHLLIDSVNCSIKNTITMIKCNKKR